MSQDRIIQLRFQLPSAATMLLLVCGLILLPGCRGDLPLSELQKMQASFRALPESEQEPALRVFAAESPAQSHFAWFELGNIYYDRSSSVLTEAGADPRQRAALLDSARIFFSRAVAIDSTFVEAYVNLGSVWEDVGAMPGFSPTQSRTEARESYERALVLRPDDEKARCNLGALYFNQQLTSKALEQFRHVLAVNPRSALAHYNMAILFATSRVYEEAIREWELASKYDGEGDIGERSRDNIRTIKQMLEVEIPAELKGDSTAG